jgi:hypothetical protein
MRTSDARFDPITVDYAIEQCTDLALLRDLARQYRKAMLDQHAMVEHALGIDDCKPCTEAVEHGDPSYACAAYTAWQKSFMDALRADRAIDQGVPC